MIEKLNISSNKFCYTGTLKIASALRCAKNFKVFDISNNFIAFEDHRIDLALVCCSCPLLQELNVSQNLLSLTDVLTIAQCFRNHATLEVLDMSDNDFNSFSSPCELIIDILLSVNQTLINLNVCGRNIRPRCIEDYLSPSNSENNFAKLPLQRLDLLHLSVDDNTQTKFIEATETCPFSSKDVISYYVDNLGDVFYNRYHNFAIIIPPGAVSQGECVELQIGLVHTKFQMDFIQ